jgi:exosome complex component RRP45
MRISSSSLIPIRDDSSGPRSQSTNERDFIKSCALRSAAGTTTSGNHQQPRSLRLDGRRANQIRSTRRISLVRWENGSSATVEWGSRVLCTCVGKVLPPPYIDRPNEGVVTISVDLSPSASMAYRNATPASTSSGAGGGGGGGGASGGGSMDESQKLESNRILRALERVLLIGGCLDTEALVVNQQWVWQLSLHVTVLDNASSSTQGGGGGNLVDASLMACMAALRHYRQPHVQVDHHGGGPGDSASSSSTSAPPILIPSHEKEPTPLPLHHTPLSLTFALIQSSESGMSTNSGNTGTVSASSSSSSSNTNHVAILLDPTHREELVAQNARLTIAMNIHKEICLLDFGGGCELQPSLLVETCCQEAAKQIPLLCQSLEKSLEQADHQALQERLAQLQQQQRSTSSGGEGGDLDQLPPLPPSSSSLLPPLLAGLNDVNAGDDNDDRDEMEGIAYYQTQDPTTVAPSKEASAQTAAAALDAQKQAEEAYRRLALDYNVGHVASKVAENDDEKDSKKQGKDGNINKNTMATTSTSRLLAAMLRSGQAAATTSAAEHDSANAVVTMAHPIQEEEQNVKGKDMSKAIEQRKPLPPAVKALETSPKKPVTAKAPLPAKKVMTNDESDDDEEETTMQLESEFHAVPLPAVPDRQKIENAAADAVIVDDDNDGNRATQDDDDDDAVDDLAAAIIKKKKSKKKKSKK